MIRLESQSSLKPAEVLERAVGFFAGPQLGLKVVERTEGHLYMEGGGGSVAIKVQAGPKTTLELVSREWDNQVKQFVQGLPH